MEGGLLIFCNPISRCEISRRMRFLGVFEKCGLKRDHGEKLFREVIESKVDSLISWSSRTDDRNEKL